MRPIWWCACPPTNIRRTEYADVMLPIAPFTETSGTFVNTEGRVQSFKGAVKPLGEARPAWKVLRVLGNLLNVQGFDYDTSEAVRDEVLNGVNVGSKLNNHLQGLTVQAGSCGRAVCSAWPMCRSMPPMR